MDLKKQSVNPKPQDAKSPASAQSAYEQSVRSDLKPEFVESVPVKQPRGASLSLEQAGETNSNPINGDPNAEHLEGGSEAEMDKILEDVNEKVKSANSEKDSKSGWLSWFKKSPAPPQAANTKHHSAKPAVVAIVAILAGLTLSAVAYFAFRQEESLKQSANTSSSAAADQSASKNTSVTPADIDSLSADIQAQVDNLDSAQDFDSTSLSDSALSL